MREITIVKRMFIPLSLFMSLVTAPNASALTTCTGSTIDISASPYFGTYTLGDDYRLTSTGTCLKFTGAGTVNLNGKTIDQTAANGTAIECLTTGITITDNGNPKGEIEGFWTTGIKNCSSIKGVRITGYPDVAIRNSTSTHPLYEVTNNIVVGWTGILADWKDRQTVIARNEFHVESTGIAIVQGVTGSSGLATIDSNYISGAHNLGIQVANLAFSVTNNMLTNRDPSLVDPSASICLYNPTFGFDWSDTNYGDCVGANCSGCSDLLPESEAPDFAVPWIVTDPCPGNVATNYTLTRNLDLAATSGSCITVTQPNVTINLNGHVIYNSLNGGTAITCSANSGTVVDSTQTGGIYTAPSGGFATGIKDCRTISDVRMQDVVTGVSNVSTDNGALDVLTGNMIDADTTAVSSALRRRTSTVSLNHIRAGRKGIQITGMFDTAGTGKADIDFNTIRESHEYAVSVSTFARVTNSTHYRRDPAAIAPTASKCFETSGQAIESALSCDCPNDCEGDQPPIVYPH